MHPPNIPLVPVWLTTLLLSCTTTTVGSADGTLADDVAYAANATPAPDTTPPLDPDSTIALLTAPAAWRLVQLRGLAVPATADSAETPVPTIAFTRDGQRIAGFGGCNRYAGRYALGTATGDGSALRFSPLTIAPRTCPGVLIENEFTQVLELVDHVAVRAGALELSRAHMPPMARFVPADR